MTEKKTDIISIRVKDLELKWKLREAAAKQKITVSTMIEKFLNDGLERLEKKVLK